MYKEGMNLFALSGLSVGLACAFLISFALFFGKTKLQRVFAVFNIAVALWGIVRSNPVLTRLFVVIAMPGSFLMAFVSIFTTWNAPSMFMQIGVGAAVILGMNALALWEPFVARVASLPSESQQSEH